MQCVECHQSDPFITNAFINAAKLPGTNEAVVPVLDADAPYYVLGGEDWDMRTIHVEDNGCFDCHRVGMRTVEIFLQNGWHPSKYMPPGEPGSLEDDWRQVLRAWRLGPEKVEGAHWIVPPARGKPRRIVGADYPHKADFNRPRSEASARGKAKRAKGREPSAKERVEIEGLLESLRDARVRRAFADWIKKNGVDAETLDKLRSMARRGKDRDVKRKD